MNNNTPNTLGDLVKRYRLLCGINQDSLSAHIDIAQSSLSKFERGVHAPNFEILDRIASIGDAQGRDLVASSLFSEEALKQARERGNEFDKLILAFSERLSAKHGEDNTDDLDRFLKYVTRKSMLAHE